MVKPKKARPRIGRPPVAAADRRGTPLHVLTTKSERAELKLAAASEGTTVSAWVRAVILKRARQIAKKLRQEERARQEEGASQDDEQGTHGIDSD